MNKKTTILFLLFVLFMSSTGVNAKSNDNDPVLSYEIKCAGTGQQGFYLVEVTALAKKKGDIKLNLVKKCAVHGVVFKGFSGVQGCRSQRPIANATAEQQHADFFKAFFQKDYLNYVSSVDPTLHTVKVKGGYEITGTVQVAKDELRNTLEKAGIVKKLGF